MVCFVIVDSDGLLFSAAAASSPQPAAPSRVEGERRQWHAHKEITGQLGTLADQVSATSRVVRVVAGY